MSNPPKNNNYIFNRNGISENVSFQRWRWIAVYNDGTFLKQFDETTGTFHQLKEIDQKKLDIFRMVRNDDQMQSDLLFRPEEMKLIHFYIQTKLEDNKFSFTSYCFGYEKNIKGVSVKHLITILPNDIFVMSDSSLNPDVKIQKK
jgi:hypothetical protein